MTTIHEKQKNITKAIAKAMEEDPEWYREFEFYDKHGLWQECLSPVDVFDHMAGLGVREKPETFTLWIDDLPKPEYYEINNGHSLSGGGCVKLTVDFKTENQANIFAKKLSQVMKRGF